jgi:hypothetical protein
MMAKSKSTKSLKAKTTRSAAPMLQRPQWIELDELLNELDFGLAALLMIHEAVTDPKESSSLSNSLWFVYRSLRDQVQAIQELYAELHNEEQRLLSGAAS